MALPQWWLSECCYSEGSVCFPDRPERSNKTPTDILPQISFSGSTDIRGQISEFPAEVTDIGDYNSFKIWSLDDLTGDSISVLVWIVAATATLQLTEMQNPDK